jgi:uncharacterized repeat protein (TIGR03803 family)
VLVLATGAATQAQVPTFTVLYSFTGGADGGVPVAALFMDAAGNLYGTTQGSGAFGWGTVFKLDTSSNETVLHNFNGDAGDGCLPIGALIMDNAGNLYGTTEDCGSGTVFKLDTSGNYTVLHSFTGSDGGNPGGNPTQL